MKINKRKFFQYGTVIILSFFWVLLKIPNPVSFVQDNDWGFQLTGANQIINGIHPYIDFVIYYGPLVHYTSAIALLLSGGNPIGEIILVVSSYTLAYFIFYIILMKSNNNFGLSFISTTIALILMPRMYKYYILIWPLLVIYFIWGYLDKPSNKRLFCLSIIVVVTGLYRQDFGIYAYISSITAVIFQNYKVALQNAKIIIKDILNFTIYTIIISLPWLIWLILNKSLENYFSYSTYITFKAVNSIAKPLILWDWTNAFSRGNVFILIYYIFQSLPAISFIFLVYQRNKFKLIEIQKIFILAIMSQLTMLQSIHRIDVPHFLQSVPLGLILFTWITSKSYNYFRVEGTRIISVFRFFPLIIYLFVINSSLMLGSIPDHSFSESSNYLKLYQLNRNDLIDLLSKNYPENAGLKIIRYVRSCSKNDDQILAYVRLTSLYYITDRGFPGNVMSINPGFPTPAWEKVIINDLETQNAIIFVDRINFSYDGNEANKFGNYSPNLHKYLYDNFIEIINFRDYTIRVNKNSVQDLSLECFSENIINK